MKKLSAKNKIYIAVLIWCGIVFAMFGYFFGMFDNNTAKLVNTIKDKQNQLQQAQIEENSFKQAKLDLAKVKNQNLQPQDFFSKDVTLVKEIQVLEALKQKYNVQISLSGVSGTVNSVPRTKIQGVVLYVPYAMTVTGPFKDVMGYIQNLENLSFTTNINSLSLNGSGGDNVSANFTASFYLKQ